MPINRFDTPVQYDWGMQHYVPQEFIPDFKAWDEILAKTQLEKDTAELIFDKVPAHYKTDTGNVSEYMKKRQEGIDQITNLYSTGDIARAKMMQSELVRQVGRDFQPGGEAKAYEDNLARIEAYKQGIQKNDKIDALTKTKAIELIDKWEGTLDQNTPGSYRTFEGRQLADVVDIPAYLTDFGKKWESDLVSKGYVKTPKGYYRHDTKEFVSESELRTHLYNVAKDNPQIQAYLKDRADLHGENADQILHDAVETAVSAAGYKKLKFQHLNDKEYDAALAAAAKTEKITTAGTRTANIGLETKFPAGNTVEEMTTYLDTQKVNRETTRDRFLGMMSIPEQYHADITPDDILNENWVNKIVDEDTGFPLYSSKADYLEKNKIDPTFEKQAKSDIQDSYAASESAQGRLDLALQNTVAENANIANIESQIADLEEGLRNMSNDPNITPTDYETLSKGMLIMQDRLNADLNAAKEEQAKAADKWLESQNKGGEHVRSTTTIYTFPGFDIAPKRAKVAQEETAGQLMTKASSMTYITPGKPNGVPGDQFMPGYYLEIEPQNVGMTQNTIQSNKRLWHAKGHAVRKVEGGIEKVPIEFYSPMSAEEGGVDNPFVTEFLQTPAVLADMAVNAVSFDGAQQHKVRAIQGHDIEVKIENGKKVGYINGHKLEIVNFYNDLADLYAAQQRVSSGLATSIEEAKQQLNGTEIIEQK